MLTILRPALAGLLLSGGAFAADPGLADFSHDQALAISQAAIGAQLSGFELRKRDNTLVSIEDYRGKPLVISLIYTSCHHICPTTTKNLDKVVQKARQALGDDSFQVISVGFDEANDSPQRMAMFASSNGIKDRHWDFLSADADTIAKLSQQLGFIFTPSPRGFDHLIQASIIDANGAVYRQLYGISFDTPLLIEPLKELIYNRPSVRSLVNHLGNRIRLFCTVYDPVTDSYYIDLSVFIGTFVGLLVSIVFGRVLFKEWRRSLRADK